MNPGRDLVTSFWRAEAPAAIQKSQDELIELAPNVEALYRWLKAGPDFPRNIETGQLETVRVAADGTRFPYVVLVPASYDPERSYPVEFMLHGGVSRPEWEPGGGWWRRGYDSLAQEDRIVVVPASWTDAFWWQDNQADNLRAILHRLKRNYNIDDNRVTLSGVSDGGTGTYFFAFKQPTEWAAFLPYIGHPGVLRNNQSGGGYRLYFENLLGKPLYIVNGEKDPLYPAASLASFIEILEQAGVDHTFRVIVDGGHNTNWLPDETPLIEQFKLDNPRDPFPDQITWVADRTDRYNRNLWIRVDALSAADRPSLLEVNRLGNVFTVAARGVAEFTLLLNPEEVDLTQPVLVNVNGRTVHAGPVRQDSETLLNWAQQDLDRTMLVTAELTLQVEP